MFQRPVVAVSLAGLLGLVIEAFALYSLSAILGWCWDKLCAYWNWFIVFLKVILFLVIGIVLGVYFFAEPLSHNKKLLDTALDVTDVAFATTQHVVGIVLGTVGNLLQQRQSTEVELSPKSEMRKQQPPQQQMYRSKKRIIYEEEEDD